MGDMVDLSKYLQEPDPEGMDREALEEYLETVRARIRQLDGQEPEDMESEAYEEWGEQHEALEDLADDIQDLLDELDG